MKTALVLSAGGMFGAYQAGAWRVLSQYFRPDMVIGASIGALNGWAIAGGCPADELVRTWRDLPALSRMRWRIPRTWLDGCFDSTNIDAVIRKTHSAYRPQLDFHLIATELPRLRARIFSGPGLTWQHLAASAAIAGLFPVYRLDGRVYGDGGILGALPLWAAAEQGASRILAINVMPELPHPLLRTASRAFTRWARPQPPPANIETVTLTAPGDLGTVREALWWTPAKVDEWIRRGEQDAEAIRGRIQDWRNDESL